MHDAYYRMTRIRIFEETCLELSSEGIADGSIHVCIGQEAIPVGVVSALDRDRDRVIATYRGHGWALALDAPTERVLAEVAHKAEGTNGGRAGSAMLSWPEGGLVAETSIVGAGAPIGCGLGLAMQRRGDQAVAVVSLGDGAMNQGAVFEALNFAAVYALPVIFVCEDNGWAEMTPGGSMTAGELAARAGAFGIRTETCDGQDVGEVKDAAERAVLHAREGHGPTFLLCRTERMSGHYNKDIEHYRSTEDKDRARGLDPLLHYRASFGDDAATRTELDQLEKVARAEIDAAKEFVLTSATDPDPMSATDFTYAVDRNQPRSADPAPRKELSYQMAANAAMRTSMEADADVFVLGEDVGQAGGIFGVTRRLWKQFGGDRVIDTPISESAILGAALGASLAGMRPIAEIMWADFAFVALDQLVNQAANVSYINRGALTAPMVVRMQQGMTPGSCAQHSQHIEGMLAGVPGLRIGLPATADDAYNMLLLAIGSDDPTIVIEARDLYQRTGEVALNRNPDPAYWRARRAVEGDEATIVTWGTAVDASIQAADVLRERHGVEVSVLDLRWVAPLDIEGLLEQVAATRGRALVVHDSPVTGGFGAEVASRIHEAGYVARRLASKDSRIPASARLQTGIRPSHEDVVQAMQALIA
ncbi:MAG TPA: thiamine pyrophosphate-dependent enzyme [Egicoccus sp.]|nr:thiamine pyrophosphate-dependent enzyme [Egicoccus sp.]HSK24615.1 thiamine pyrophosphate-dependent enzyme [Egicoccus sp.]